MYSKNLVPFYAMVFFAFAVFGCGSREELNEKKAITLVREFVPVGSRSSISESIKRFKLTGENVKSSAGEVWSAVKSGDGVYRVIFHSEQGGTREEFIFGVDITKGRVVGLNRRALAFTQP